jgi:hypothetical protein
LYQHSATTRSATRQRKCQRLYDKVSFPILETGWMLTLSFLINFSEMHHQLLENPTHHSEF